MVRNKQGLVHNCKTNTAEEYNKENIEDYAQYPNNIGGGLLMFPETAFQITIVRQSNSNISIILWQV
jgi:hypothetical protein